MNQITLLARPYYMKESFQGLTTACSRQGKPEALELRVIS
jgi:hypothetical protein